nr:putative ribonuclease H-like domain-containing protein [Tanacetum cinerariifolium]
MTNYSLWEVILNGDSPIPTRVVDVSDVTSVSAASTKVLVSALPNVDNLSDAVIYSFFASQSNNPQLDSDDLKEIDVDDLENLGANGTTSIGFDMSKVECYNCHRRGHFTRKCSEMVLVAMIGAFRKSQFDVHSYKTGLESIEARLVVYQQNENVFEEDIKLLKLDVMLRDNALVELRKKFEKVEQERDELGYDNKVFNSIVFDCDELLSSESDVSMHTSLVHDRYKLGERYHVVPPPYTGTFMPPKPDLVFYDAPTANEHVPTVLNVKPSTTKPNKDLSNSNRPSAPFIDDWVSEDEYKGEPMPTQKEPSFVQTSKHVKTPRPSVKPVKHPTPAKNLRKDIPKSREHGLKACQEQCNEGNSSALCKDDSSPSHRHVVTTLVLTRFRLVPLTAARPVTTAGVKRNWVWKPKCPILDHVSKHTSNPLHALKGKGVIDSGCSRHITGNIFYLSDFKEINGEYVAFGGNPKGGKITGKDSLGKFDGKDDEGFLVGYDVSSKAFRVFNSRTRIVQETLHINFLENQPNVAGSEPAWLFDIDTLTQSMNYQPVEAKSVQQYVLLPLWSSGSKDPQNTDAAAFKIKEPEFAVHVSLSSCEKTKKHDDKTKREAKEKSPVELSMGVRDLSDEFEEFFDNSTNGVNAASTPVTTVGLNSTNSTNSFSAGGPFNNVVSLNFELGGKSVFVDPSQHPDDLDMPALEDITYSDNEEDVGGAADFSNLETSITVSPIPTTRVHKDHPVIQIIGDLSSAPQTREEGIDYEEVFAPVARIEAIRLFLAYDSFMGFMVYQMDVKSDFLYGTIKEEVHVFQPPRCEDPDHLDKVYNVVKELYGMHQAPRACPDQIVSGKDYSNPLMADNLPKIAIINVVRSKLMLFGLTIDAGHLMLLGHKVSAVEGGCIQIGGIAKLDADEDVTLEEVDAEVTMDAYVYGRLEESQAKLYHLDLEPAEKVLAMQDTDEAEPAEVEECSKEKRGVIIQDPEEAATASVIVQSKVKSKDKGKGILVKRLKPLKIQAQIKHDEAFARELVMRYQALKNKPVTEAHARKNMMVYLKNMAGLKMDFFRGMTYTEIRPIFEKHYNSIQAFLEKGEKEIEEEGSKRKTKTNPLALKVPVVDFQIHHEHNKPFYKIIRADGTHQLFLSFITLLKNFDREDLEMLWKLVQERFQSLKPKNFLDDFLLNTLKTMFEKPNVEANIRRDQRGRSRLAKVKRWMLFESCGVHILTLTTTQMILLVEKKYPLTRFTLE